MIYWEITSKCNLDCDYCLNKSYRSHTRELETSDMLTIAENLAKRYNSGVVITGGEPMLRTDLPALVAHLRTHGVKKIHLVTNGFSKPLDTVLDGLFDRIAYTVHLRNGEREPDFSPVIQGLTELSCVNSVEVNFLLSNHTKNSIAPLITDITKKTAVRKFQLQRIIVKSNHLRDQALSDDAVKQFVEELKKIKTSQDIEISVNDFTSADAKYYVVRSDGILIAHTATSEKEIGSLLHLDKPIPSPLIPLFSKRQLYIQGTCKQ